MARKLIVAFAFGSPQRLSSNKVIAEIATTLSWSYAAPIFTQRDVLISSAMNVRYATEHIGCGPPSILQVAREAVQWSYNNDVEDIIVVTASPQMWICLRDLKEEACAQSVNHLYVKPFASRDAYDKNFWFCEKSFQWHTKNLNNWRLYEFMLKLLPYSLYKLM